MPPRFDSSGRLVGESDEDLFNEEEWMGSSGYARTTPSSSNDADEILSRIPIIGAGSRAALDAQRAEREAERNREYWDQLTDYMPTADDLSVDYDTEDFIGGGESEWRNESDEDAAGGGAMMDALDLMGTWAEGGLTDTDRAMADENRRAEAMRARGDREAALSAMEARGMGGSGMDLMARMGADEAAAGRASSANTSLLAAAQQRQFNAANALGGLGSAVASSDDARTNALDAWSARETDYARGLEGRNTGYENNSRESRANANQGAYENRERAVAGATNQYSTDVGRRSAENNREDEADDDIGALIGAGLTALGS
jgi:hypothetical protein